MQATLLVESEM